MMGAPETGVRPRARVPGAIRRLARDRQRVSALVVASLAVPAAWLLMAVPTEEGVPSIVVAGVVLLFAVLVLIAAQAATAAPRRGAARALAISAWRPRRIARWFAAEDLGGVAIPFVSTALLLALLAADARLGLVPGPASRHVDSRATVVALSGGVLLILAWLLASAIVARLAARPDEALPAEASSITAASPRVSAEAAVTVDAPAAARAGRGRHGIDPADLAHRVRSAAGLGRRRVRTLPWTIGVSALGTLALVLAALLCAQRLVAFAAAASPVSPGETVDAGALGIRGVIAALLPSVSVLLLGVALLSLSRSARSRTAGRTVVLLRELGWRDADIRSAQRAEASLTALPGVALGILATAAAAVLPTTAGPTVLLATGLAMTAAACVGVLMSSVDVREETTA